LFLLALIWRVRLYWRRRKFYRQLKQFDGPTSALLQFYKNLRSLENIEDPAVKVKNLQDHYKLFITRHWQIPAALWTNAETLKELRRKKIATEFLRSVKKTLQEHEASYKRIGQLKPEDITMLIRQTQKSAEVLAEIKI
ncbi:MAG: hypothetical protein ACOYOK_06790, partial [Pseudobdellovibrionaceae bacterium]